MTYSAKVIAGGKIVIPAELRREFGIKDGDVILLARNADGSLTIKTHEQIIREGQERIRAELKSPVTVDDLIADRRVEAASE